MKKIKVISDIHGILPPIENASNIDYLLIGGDIVPYDIQMNPILCYKWLKNSFFSWCSQFKKVILIAGNHDFIFALLGNKIHFPDNIIYLDNEYYSDDFIEVFGSANMKVFGQFFERGSDCFNETFKGFKKNDKKHILLLHHPLFWDVPIKNVDYIFYGHYHTLYNNRNIKNRSVITENVSYCKNKPIKTYIA